ncbi:ENKD1 [Branchiostoma lanceolatum]|uniref:ENKD1 protein n=1 Tax=Branchiostoma lanceolatum TaxID=7740 RepID=A0A8K0EBA8_BRALA|nr:ENKD1 [Branchiostoma lanceolatum]
MAVTMSGHINRDPCSGTGLYAYDEHRPVPKVRPEAQNYYESGTKGSVGLLFELQGMSIRPRSKAPPRPADHIRENVRRMRQVQRESRRRQEEANKPMKPLFKSTKWEGVESKVKKKLENVSSSQSPWPTPRPESRNFLRSHSRQGQPRPRSASPSIRPRTMSAGAVRPQSARATPAAGHSRRSPSPCTLDGGKENGRRGEVPSLEVTGTKTGSPIRDDVDFVAHNARRAWKDCNRLKRPPTQMALQDLEERRKKDHDLYKRGEVPKYLRNRQGEWKKEEEERIRNTPDPSMPPGHTMMPEAERKDTLKKLRESEQDLLKQMRELPIGRSDTLRIKHAKEELEKKLSEIDEAIKIFSRPKVFVKIDD